MVNRSETQGKDWPWDIYDEWALIAHMPECDHTHGLSSYITVKPQQEPLTPKGPGGMI